VVVIQQASQGAYPPPSFLVLFFHCLFSLEASLRIAKKIPLIFRKNCRFLEAKSCSVTINPVFFFFFFVVVVGVGVRGGVVVVVVGCEF
jgi:hypothetical protein